MRNRITTHEGDLRNTDAISQIAAHVKPAEIYHLAGYGGHPYQHDDHRTMETMVMGTVNLVRACAKHGFEVFVNAGCSSEYGWKSRPMSEEDALVPNSYYSVAKASQTLYCQFTSRQHDLPIITARLFPVYGPWEEPVRLMPTLITHCLQGKEVNLTSPDTARDFIYIDDAVDALLAISQITTARGQIFNVGSGRQATLKEVTDCALDATGAKIKLLWNSVPPRPWDTGMWVADNSKIRKMTHWQPRTTLEEGIKKTTEWMRAHTDQYVAMQKERSAS